MHEVTAEKLTDPAFQVPSTAGMTTKVVKGSLWTLLGQVLPLGVSLVTTPFVTRMLGAALNLLENLQSRRQRNSIE